MRAVGPPPGVVRWTRWLEDSAALDRPVRLVEPTIRRLFGSGSRGALLRGDWLGHAVHPLLTDLVLGSWTSASVLDLTGGPDGEASARRLVGTGLLLVGPTAWTGWAEWSASGARDKRVGFVHAVTNGVAIGAYAASWVARRRDRHGTGVGLALAGGATTGLGAYLGSHLAVARKVGSHHAAYDEVPAAPEVPRADEAAGAAGAAGGSGHLGGAEPR